MNKYNQELPQEVEQQLDAYIDRIKAIKWFTPDKDLKKEVVDNQINVSLKAFGVEASIEYRKLKMPSDWDAARDSAWDAAWDSARGAARGAAWDAAWGAARGAARGAAWDSARGAAWDAAWGAARDAAWGAAWDAARGAADVLALNLEEYKKKYPQGNFINLIPLWEMGLYPFGVVNGKFIVYIPASKLEFPDEFID